MTLKREIVTKYRSCQLFWCTYISINSKIYVGYGFMFCEDIGYFHLQRFCSFSILIDTVCIQWWSAQFLWLRQSNSCAETVTYSSGTSSLWRRGLLRAIAWSTVDFVALIHRCSTTRRSSRFFLWWQTSGWGQKEPRRASSWSLIWKKSLSDISCVSLLDHSQSSSSTFR